MKSGALKLSILAFVVVTLVSLIPYLGTFVIAPLAALAIGAAAGRRAATVARDRAANEAAWAGTLVGVAALIGSIVGLALLITFVVDIPAVQEFIRSSEPNPEARIPYEWMVPLGALSGVVVGFFVGLFDLLLALGGGLVAGWIVNHNRAVPA